MGNLGFLYKVGEVSLLLLVKSFHLQSLEASVFQGFCKSKFATALPSPFATPYNSFKMSDTTNLTHGTGHGTGYGNATLLANPQLCTLQTCDLSMASFFYIPTLAGNAIYAGIFGAYLLAQLYLGIKHRTWGYMVAMILGLVSSPSSSY